MHWRRRAALAVLGLGWVVWLTNVAERTPAADPQYVSPPVKHDADFRKQLPRAKYPRRGAIGYRDELNPDTPEAASARNQLYLLYQYIHAPLLLDRDGRHDLTLVLTPTRIYLERSGGTP